jgi:hypothetical protein
MTIKTFNASAKSQFCKAVMDLVLEDPDINYLTAIQEVAEKNDIDLTVVGKLIDKPLRDKVHQNAVELHYFKGNKSQLPFV